MIKHVSLASILVLSVGALVPSASALTARQARECRAMSASLQVRQKEADVEVEERQDLLDLVEVAGDEWEDAEVLRLFSPAQATDADSKKAVYDDLKNNLMRREIALQSSVAMINSDVAAYRGRCVKK